MTGEPIAGNPMADELVERVARAICLTQGEDPETLDMHRYCDANNQPMPLWNWYAEQAEAAISAIPRPSITADAVAWRWRYARMKAAGEWFVTDATPECGGYHDLEHEPLFTHPAPEGAAEDPHQALHLYAGDSALVIRDNGNKTLHGVQLPELLALFKGDTEPGDLVERLKEGWASCDRYLYGGATDGGPSGTIRSRSLYDCILEVARVLSSLRAERDEAREANKQLETIADYAAELEDKLDAAESSLAAEKQRRVDLERARSAGLDAIKEWAKRVAALEGALTDARTTLDELWEHHLHNTEAGCEAWADVGGAGTIHSIDALLRPAETGEPTND